MDLPPRTALPDSVTLDPIPQEELQLVPYRNMSNDIISGHTLDPLNVLEVFQTSFTFPEWQIFRAAMIEDSGLMVGSSCMAALGVTAVRSPHCLDILVGRDRGKAVHSALRNFGFYSTPAEIKPWFNKTIVSVWRYSRFGSKSVNIVETKYSTVWTHILSSPSTAHTAFLSATHAFVLDPKLTLSRVALLRNTQFTPWERGHTFWNRLVELGWTVCRNNASSIFVKDAPCPALRRSLWGGEGIWHCSWSSIMESGSDYYYQLAARGFKTDELWYVWQFATHCSDWNCQYGWMSNKFSVDGNL